MSRVERATGAAETAVRPHGGGLLTAFSSLANRNFRYLWFGQVGSALAMHADLVARSWLAWELTGSTFAVAAVNLARALPMLALGLFGGVVADRFEKRRTLMLIQTWSFLIYAGMAAIVLSGIVEMWHVYTYALLLGFGMAMNQPVRTSFIPQLVSRDRMMNALSLNSIAINSTRLFGPAVIAFVIYLTDVGMAFMVSAGVYVVVIFMTTRIRPPKIEQPRERGSMYGQLMEGFRYMLDNRLVFALVLIGLGPLAFGHSYVMLLPAYVSDVLLAEVNVLGIIMSASAVGGLTGGLFIASRGNVPHKGYVLLITTGLYGAILLSMGWITTVWLTIAAVIGIGATQTAFRAANTTTLMEITPDRLRGRIISVTLLDNALQPVAGLIAGAAADAAGVSYGFVTLGAICLAIMVVIMLAYPALRKV